jgi:hypothetical protein
MRRRIYILGKQTLVAQAQPDTGTRSWCEAQHQPRNNKHHEKLKESKFTSLSPIVSNRIRDWLGQLSDLKRLLSSTLAVV